MSQLQVALLGEPRVKHGEQTLIFSTRKAQALLVYLAVEGGTHTRKTLSEAFWPDLDAEHGRAGLRASIFELRKLLDRSQGSGEQAHLLVERETLGLAQDSSLLLDLRLVEAVSKRVGGRRGEPLVDQVDAELLEQLEQATRLVRGPFLAGFSLRDSQFFDDWTRQQREYWHLRVHQLFDTLSRLCEGAGEVERALETVSRWLGFDPLHEEGYRRLMRLRFSSGDRVGALRAYTTCRDVLASELELEPEPETVALVTWIRRSAPVRSVSFPSLHSSPEEPPAKLLNGPYVGRSAQFGSLIESYQRVHAGQPYLVVLQGETGMGKTRLASEFAGWAQAQGAQVLMGKALHTGRQLPYQPLIALLRHHLEQEHAPDQLVGKVWLAEFARLLPELRERSADLPVPTTDEMLGHSRLLEAMTRLLRAWAARRPLVLLLDDMQWADTATHDLLLYFAQSLAERPAPILLLLTLRTGAAPFPDPQSSWVMALKGTGIPLSTLGLAPFTQEETLRFVQALAWVKQAPEAEHHRTSDRCPQSEGSSAFGEHLVSLAHWLYVQTHGQPSYLAEILKGLIEQEIVVPLLQKDGTWGLLLKPSLLAQTPTSALIPASARERIRCQLEQLSSSACCLLVAAAVMGEGLTFERLCQVAQLNEETGLQALEEVLRRGWLYEENRAKEAQACEEYRFAGEMIRAVVSEQAGTTRQRLVQRRVATVLQEEAEYEQGEEASLPYPTPLDGHAAGESRERPQRRVVAGAVTRDRRGMGLVDQLAIGTINWPRQMNRRRADASRCQKTPLSAWERGAAAQAPFAFPRSPPGSPARAF
jgi:DNA-binding SARP family transcriptional activator